MSKEESVVFPWIRVLESGSTYIGEERGTLDQRVSTMMMEHDDAGKALAKMRVLTNGFAPSHGACGTYRVMLSGLAELESDMHIHVHKENSILFPRALALEASRPAV